MRTKLMIISVFLFLFLFVAGCSSNKLANKKSENNIELTISAAASLKASLEKIKREYELEHPNIKLKFNYGGSGSLKQQITQGAPVDLFFSAAEDKLNELVEDGFIAKDDVIILLENELVLVVPNENTNNISSIQDLIHNDVGHISIGIPETVPAGEYAKESLINLELWGKIEPKIVYAKDVRQVLSFVETGNVEAGIVYHTDALMSDKLAIIHMLDSTTHSPIQYPVGIINETKHYNAAKDFYNYLQNEESVEVFKEYGFITK